MQSLPNPTKVAGLVLAWLASNLAWTLFSGFVGALISAILRDKGVFENTYGLVAIGLLVAAVLASAPAITRRIRLRHREGSSEDKGGYRGAAIRAGHAIRAGGSIEADTNIEAGWGIEAGGNVQAGTSTPVREDKPVRAALLAAAPPNEGWVDPEQLGHYLESINQTMAKHGFGRNPNLPPSVSTDARATQVPHSRIEMNDVVTGKMGRQKAERLVALYRDGERLRASIFWSASSIPGDLIRGTANQSQVERERLARDWDTGVLAVLADDHRRKWISASTLLEAHPARSLIEPTTNIAGIRDFLTAKLDCLKEIISQLEADQPEVAPADSTAGVPTETVTPESIDDELSAFVPWAGRMLQGEVVIQEQVDDWAGKVGISIRVRGPRGEEDMFLAVGHNLDPRAELEAKVARLQDHILPKVRAGEWTR
jgi:hypothetical protein